MSDQIPDPYSVRQLSGQWQVLLAQQNCWLNCHDEQDARAIAKAPVLEHECLSPGRTDEDFAVELERVADVLERYRIGFGSRFLRYRARVARGEPLPTKDDLL